MSVITGGPGEAERETEQEMIDRLVRACPIGTRWFELKQGGCATTPRFLMLLVPLAKNE